LKAVDWNVQTAPPGRPRRDGSHAMKRRVVVN
jgi:hypothetical protein